MRKEIWAKARTTHEIHGLRIPTIPVGTEFEVLKDIQDDSNVPFDFGALGQARCRGLAVTSVWLYEFEFA